jgi:hypothetical protein
MKALKSTLVVFAAAGAMLSGPALADNDHWDIFSCYAQVHDGCFNDSNSDCSEDVYNEFLDMCDTAYDRSGRRPAATASFAVKTNPQVKAKIMQSFAK